MGQFWRLAFIAPDATPEQATRGVAAAQALFEKHGTTAVEVADALWNREADELSGAFIPEGLVLDRNGAGSPEQVTTERQFDIADLWWDAEGAAVKACYGADHRPDGAELRLLQDDADGEPGDKSAKHVLN